MKYYRMLENFNKSQKVHGFDICSFNIYMVLRSTFLQN